MSEMADQERKGAAYWAMQHEAFTVLAGDATKQATEHSESDIRSPGVAELVMILQSEALVYATLANAAATRLLVETYDGHHMPPSPL